MNARPPLNTRAKHRTRLRAGDDPREAGAASQTSPYSPYTTQNVEAAILHLEQMLRSDTATQLFNGAYWRTRIGEASATPGLLPGQRSRLARLMGIVETTA